MHPIRSILVPVDFSPHSDEATTWALDLARRFDARVTLLHVYQPIGIALPDGYVMQGARSLSDLLAAMHRSLEATARDLEAANPGVTITTRLLQGAVFAEVVRCAREGVTINTFMLEDSPGLVRFVNEMSRINRGRAFFVQPDRLGEYVLVDYVTGRRRAV